MMEQTHCSRSGIECIWRRVHHVLLCCGQKQMLDYKKTTKSNNFDKKNDFNVWLYNNISKSTGVKQKNNTLFENDYEDFFLLPEIGSVDYILKFSGDEPIFTQLLTKASSIKEIVSIYEIPKKRLKSKENLIFEY